jgi:preprotein translocase subunit SecG
VQTLYNVSIVIGMIVALVFSALVFLTGKGDAMSGGGGVRTTFKGKAGFDDFMSKLTLYMGIGFMVLMLVIDVLGSRATTP